jgi:photosystem II stability/assembly factor-like uncharacterized protein
MVKKYLLVAVCAVMLSGCTVKLPVGNPAPTGSVDPSDAFGKTVQPGSIWKSIDGGKLFEVKSRIDDTQSIAKADVLALSFHPTDHETLYIGTVDNGIFKTTDGAETWQPIAFPPKKIYSFILDKNLPDERMFASGNIGDVGKVFRTDDGGETWRAVYTEPSSGVVITILAQHPRDMSVIFAGTSTGTVVKSTDGGETWKNVGRAVDGPITDIVFDAAKQYFLYAFSFGGKVYFSEDGGLTWQNVATDPPKDSGLLKIPDGLLSITVDPSISGRVYGTTTGGLYRSDNFGVGWKKLNIIESAEKLPIRSVAVNPTNASEIVFTAGSVFYKSINGGETWSVVDVYIDRSVSVLAYDPSETQTIYMMLRKIK